MNENRAGVRRARLLGWCRALNTPCRGAPAWRPAHLLQQNLAPPGRSNFLGPQGSEIPFKSPLPLPPQRKKELHVVLCKSRAPVSICVRPWACKERAPYGNSACEILDGVMPGDSKTGPLP